MASEYTEIDSIPDDSGDEIAIVVIGRKVMLCINEGTGVFLDAAGRDRFAKAWAEAERQAEARQRPLCGSCVPYGACQGAGSIERCPAPEAERQAEAAGDA